MGQKVTLKQKLRVKYAPAYTAALDLVQENTETEIHAKEGG